MKKTFTLGLISLFLLSCFCFMTAAAEVSADGGLVAYWEQTGNNHIQISNYQKIVVNITQYGTVKASFNVGVSCDVGKVGLSPLWQGTMGIAPQETGSVTISVSNLGVEEQIDNIPITITVHETYLGTELARVTVYATLLATLRQGQTNLIMSAIEKGTEKPAVGVELKVLYPSNGQGEQKQVWTDTKGEAILNLDMFHGGAYIGDIEIQIVESDAYFAKNITSAVHLDNNEITLEVEPKNPQYDSPDETNWTLLLLIAMMITIVVLVGIIILLRKK